MVLLTLSINKIWLFQKEKHLFQEETKEDHITGLSLQMFWKINKLVSIGFPIISI